MLSLIGKLAHACKVLQVGRLFLRRMIDHSTKAKKLDHWIHLTSDFRADLPWVTPPHSHPGITEEAADIGSPGLVVARLEGIAQGLVQDSRAASSQRAYHTAQKSFGSFCASLGILAVPASEHLLLLYAAHLSQHVCHATVRSYLSAIRHLHLSHGFQDPLKQSGQLELALKGLKQRKPRTADSHCRLLLSHCQLSANLLFAILILTTSCWYGLHVALDSLHSCDRDNSQCHPGLPLTQEFI